MRLLDTGEQIAYDVLAYNDSLLNSGLADLLATASAELFYLESNYGVRFDAINYGLIAKDQYNFCNSINNVSDICEVNEEI
jgi:hypothetical protein